ncbi:MAG: apolipoprotein N-acyltransferase [Deltaproteobacteria bacterium]
MGTGTGMGQNAERTTPPARLTGDPTTDTPQVVSPAPDPKRRRRPPAESTAPPTAPVTKAGPAAPAPAGAKLTRDEWVKYATLAVLAGVIWFLSCADFDVWPFAWFAMVPTLYVTERVHTNRQAFFFAWLTGAVGNGGGFYWIAGLLVRFGHMPWIAALPIFLLLAAYQGLVFGAFGAVTRAVRKHTRLPMALIAPLAMVTFELLIPMIFPFSVAITQAWQPHVIQIADLTGPLGVSALLLASNGALYDLLLEKPRRVKPAIAAIVVIAASLVYGHVRMGQVDRARAAAPQLTVGVVQTNVAFDMKGPNRARFAARQLDDLNTQTAALQSEGADLVVWPETAFPYPVQRARTEDFPREDPRHMRRQFDVPVVVGAVTWAMHPDGSRRDFWNSAMVMDRQGHYTGRADKIFLMVFGEYTPGRDTFAIISRLMPSTTGQYQRGASVHTLPFVDSQQRAWRLGPMICYEDIIADFGRQLAGEHPHLLVNITNDSWFGDTSEPWEHLALSVFRAVEMRTDLVRAVNTGVSAFVDANGRVHHRTYAVDPVRNPRGADHSRATVAMLEGGHTVFSVIGNVFAYLCALGTLFLWLVKPRLARRGRSDGQSTP